ncbi:hypothetical protein EV694_1936 [Volucribacter psittacicida]|uniref:Uncharacterized protein n=1 Tax=Volucribacter psittacicida TaxID=203482 RepID=A0A4R1FMW4_9PAST|nr:hypothetical protein [Volucribacter psittacicida]TCJ95933.1 hypothetical protein EV694_1936 [Volucribacter psittacicida]
MELELGKVLLTLEIELDENSASELVFSKNTEVLGGKVLQVNWEGSLFGEVNWYRALLDGKTMAFLAMRDIPDERLKRAFSKALNELVAEIKEEEAEQDKDELPY